MDEQKLSIEERMIQNKQEMERLQKEQLLLDEEKQKAALDTMLNSVDNILQETEKLRGMMLLFLNENQNNKNFAKNFKLLERKKQEEFMAVIGGLVGKQAIEKLFNVKH